VALDRLFDVTSCGPLAVVVRPWAGKSDQFRRDPR
jgi:hypothetical protein